MNQLQTESRRSRVAAYDFIRIASCLGVFLFHFDDALKRNTDLPGFHSMPEWTGFLFVTCFFVLSGSLTEYHYGQSTNTFSVRDYLKRRWISIYPLFYLCYFPVFAIAAFRRGSFFFKEDKWTWLFSLAGLDGYFSSAFDTYYLVGEWFLGALIILYILYPLFRNAFNRLEIPFCICIFLLFCIAANKTMLAVSPLANILSCLVSFLVGMAFERHCRKSERLYRNTLLCIVVFLTGIFFCQMNQHIKLSQSIPLHLAGFILFLFLFLTGQIFFGERQESKSGIKRAMKDCAELTYPFYLVHHVIIDKGMSVIKIDMNAFYKIVIIGLLLFGLSLMTAWIVRRIESNIRRMKKTKPDSEKTP